MRIILPIQHLIWQQLKGKLLLGGMHLRLTNICKVLHLLTLARIVHMIFGIRFVTSLALSLTICNIYIDGNEITPILERIKYVKYGGLSRSLSTTHKYFKRKG